MKGKINLINHRIETISAPVKRVVKAEKHRKRILQKLTNKFRFDNDVEVCMHASSNWKRIIDWNNNLSIRFPISFNECSISKMITDFNFKGKSKMQLVQIHTFRKDIRFRWKMRGILSFFGEKIEDRLFVDLG